MLTWVGATFIVGGIAVVTAICGGRYHGKYLALKKQYSKLTKDLTNALGEVGRVKLRNESLAEDNKWLEERIQEYKHLTTTGCRNLKVKVFNIPDVPELPKYSIAVVGVDTMNPDLEFVVKGFTADNEEDRDFAIREAEELIETIKRF